MSDYDEFVPLPHEPHQDDYADSPPPDAFEACHLPKALYACPPDYESHAEPPLAACDYEIPEQSFEHLQLKFPLVATASRGACMATFRRPLRLAFIGPPLTIGGVDQHTRALAKFFDPEVVRATKYLIVEDHRRAGGDAHNGSLPVQYCHPRDISKATEDCDVVLIWGCGFNQWLEDCRAIRIFLAHGESGWTRRCLESSSRVIDHVVAVSPTVKQRVCHGFPTTVILNGVDAARLAPTRSRGESRARYGFRDEDFVVGFLGRFTREKRVDLLIEAVSLLPSDFKLLIVGCGRRKLEVLELANTCIPGRYALVSATDYLGDYYGAMDAFVLLSEHEGFGLVIPEAMLCNCPVVATNVGCVPEVIQPNASGIVIQPDACSVADALRRLRDHPTWAKAMATEAHQFASRHLHASRMARDYESLLCQLAAQRAASSA
jgi:glycosyltransferase involved in cell wall biosynthesis